MIASGQAEIAFCSGTEAPIVNQPMVEFGLAKLSPRNARKPTEMGRPFDLWRNTGVIGEGACVILLESEDSPAARLRLGGGVCLCERRSSGFSGNGLAATMKMALANAQCSARRRRPDQRVGSRATPKSTRSRPNACADLFGERP